MTRQTVTFEVSVELSARVNRTPNPSIYALSDIEAEAFLIDGIEQTPATFAAAFGSAAARALEARAIAAADPEDWNE